MGKVTPRYWETKALADMSREEWEGLCDGCGKCCLLKLQDDDTGEISATNITCRLLDRKTARCSDYRNRRSHVPDCVRLTPAKLKTVDWLPSTCAYRLIADGEPLPLWHPLETGDPETVHDAGISIRGWTVSENDAGPIEHHLVDREL